MSLSATARRAAAQAFEAAGDAATSVTLRLGPSEGAYDVDADQATVVWEQETEDVKAIGYADKRQKSRAEISTRVRSFIVRGADVTAGRPNQSGEIVEDGVTWQIATAEKDPTAAIWIFHCTA